MADAFNLNLSLNKVPANESPSLTSFPHVEIVSLVSASRSATVERLIFICDLVNSETLAKEAWGTQKESTCQKENSHAVRFWQIRTQKRLL